MTFTRGFSGRRARDPRLPPGQYDAGKDWPVLTAEATPRLSTDNWTFTIEGLVEEKTSWTWAEMMALPPSQFMGDIDNPYARWAARRFDGLGRLYKAVLTTCLNFRVTVIFISLVVFGLSLFLQDLLAAIFLPKNCLPKTH